MSEAKFETQGSGRFRVIGPMNFESVASLLAQSHRRFDQGDLAIDLGAVTETDSAGLALVIEWVKQVRAANQTLRFENLPGQLVALARISEVDDLLGIADQDDSQPLAKQSVG